MSQFVFRPAVSLLAIWYYNEKVRIVREKPRKIPSSDCIVGFEKWF
jgi:hypothetical protein